MKVLVTGGSGFIGSRLVDGLLTDGYQVVILDLVVNPRFADITVQGDVSVPGDVARCMPGVEIVYNLAAQHRDDVFPIERYYQTNVEGMRVLCDAMTREGVRRMMFTSSVAIYGFDLDDGDEESAKDPDNHYGRSKLQAEAVLDEWARLSPANRALVIRPCAVFGPKNRGNIYNLLAQIMSGRFLMVGSGENRKSIAYVENVVAAIRFVAARNENTVVNYADKPDLSMNEMVTLVAKAGGIRLPRLRLPKWAAMLVGRAHDVAARLLGRTFQLSAVRVEKFCANSVVNADRIRHIGFEAPHTLVDGLRTTIASEFGRGESRS